MTTRVPFAPGEWYHCYTRGVEKRKIFLSESDYERFLLLLYISNGEHAIHISELPHKDLQTVLADPTIVRGNPLVELGAYCLMPNHVHFLCKEATPGGITRFMLKVLTGYSMYFNKKYEHVGPLFAGTFKSKHVNNDAYFKRAWSYIHLNPAELFEHHWKLGKANLRSLERKLADYRYSSLHEFASSAHGRDSVLLSKDVSDLFDKLPTLREMLTEAQAYYADNPQGVPSRTEGYPFLAGGVPLPR